MKIANNYSKHKVQNKNMAAFKKPGTQNSLYTSRV